MALASTPPNDSTLPRDNDNTASARVGETDVAARLAAIRDAVSTITEEEAAKDAASGNVRTAWWANWHGGGVRFDGWRNGGWGNGGWRNWGNGWHNGWHNGWFNW